MPQNGTIDELDLASPHAPSEAEQTWNERYLSLPCMALLERCGVVLRCNPQMERLIGGAVAAGEPLENVLPGFLARLERCGGRSFDALLLQRGGRLAQVRAAVGPVEDYGQSQTSLILLMEMGTSAQLPCSENQVLHQDLLDSAPDAMAVTRDGKLVHFNQEFGRMFGYSKEEGLGQVLDDLVIPDGLRHESEILTHTAQATGRASIETVRRTRTGEYLEVWVLITLAKKNHGADEAFVVYRDIRRQKQAEARWQHRALHDALTGLANRHLFLDRVRETMRRLRRRPDRNFAVLFLDLDLFKQVNDTLGHAAGDKLLLETTGRLRACMRPQDTIARMGGDEFALLLNEVESREDAARVAERVQQSIQREVELEEGRVFVSASIGIALGSNGYEKPEEILRDADLAMYEAKQAGKAQHQFFER